MTYHVKNNSIFHDEIHKVVIHFKIELKDIL